MDRDRFQRVKDLFRRALPLDATERIAFLDLHCAADPDLRGEILELLAHAVTAETWFLDGARGRAGDAPAQPTLEIPGFQIVGEIAAGGAGIIYRALQLVPRREVALKVLRLDTLGHGQVARFVREAEILAALNHHGIAHVHGAGVVEAGSIGLPWIAMELVRGVELDAYVRQHALDARGVLLLFRDLCAAVDHAHERGIVHRDLKPSNVLVEPGGRPRVLDFGVARILGDADVSASRQTRTGAVIGTLAYMAPEQARGERGAIDARTDVYALGVMLHEALTERLPLDIEDMDVIEAVRVVCGVEPERLARVRPDLPADLDAIVGKALEKEPDRRYARAGELAADIENLLANRPVRARRPTTVEQARKFVQRHRGLVIGTAVIFLSLAVALAISLVAWKEQTRQRAVTSETLDFLASRMTALSPQLGFGESQRADLEEVAVRIERQLDADPASRALRAARAQTWYEIASLDQARRDFEGMRARLETARAIREELVREDPADVASRTHLSQICAKLGEAARDTGDLAGRDAWFERALEIDAALVRDYPDDLEFVEDLGWSLARLSQAASERGDHAESERLLLRRLDDAERLVAREPHNWKFAYNLSHVHYFLAGIRQLAGRPDLELVHAIESAELAQRVREMEPARRDFLAWSTNVDRRAAGVLSGAGRQDEARALAERALRTAEDLGLGDPRRAAHLELVRLAAADYASPGLGGPHGERIARASACLRRVAETAARAGNADGAAELLAAADEVEGQSRRD